MSDPQTNPIKRLLLWLSGAPAEAVQAKPAAPPLVQSPTPEPAPADLPAASDPEQALTPDAAPAAATAVVAGAETGDSPDRNRVVATAASAASTQNDAAAYGVTVVPSDVSAGTMYWHATLVHHLTPDENHANHHIFLDALDEQGARLNGARGRITWDGGEQVVTVDKPANEPGTNFPMWKWQVCTVEMLDLPSDRVTGLHTGHPDEPPGTGNTLFHHSFAVQFQRAIKGGEASRGLQALGSVISGTASDAAGHELLLTLEGEIMARQPLDAAGAYRFEGVPAGDYLLVIEGSGVHSGIVSVDGKAASTVDLAVPASAAPADSGAKFIDRYFLFGVPHSARTAVYLDLARSYLLANQPTFGFRAEDAMHAQRVVLMGGIEDIPQATEDALRQAGSQVQRISGTPQQIQDALQHIDMGGHQIFLPMTPLDTSHGQ